MQEQARDMTLISRSFFHWMRFHDGLQSELANGKAPNLCCAIESASNIAEAIVDGTTPLLSNDALQANGLRGGLVRYVAYQHV